VSWLDPQTRELLERSPPERRAPAKTSEFGLVLLRKPTDQRRLERAIERVNASDTVAAAALALRPAPVFINLDLSYGDALLGQFELICCDAPSAILPSEVLERGDARYLADLFAQVAASEEFRQTSVPIHALPDSEEGARFADQFLGFESLASLAWPLELTAPLKKGRIMAQWAERIGGRVEVG
jgi:hypothetical protein